jgi:chromosome transmission fidelity protein 4
MEVDGKINHKNSHLYYKPFNEWKQFREWHVEFKDGEKVECLALGTGWVAVQTDFGYVRVFSMEGIQKYIFSHGTPIVTLLGYENLLVMIYHSGPSVYGFQTLRMKCIDMQSKSYNVLYDTDCPITVHSNLVWAGFSEEGQIFTYDNEGVLRCQNPQNKLWIPILDFKQKYPAAYANMWIVGMCEGEVLAIELAKGYNVPPMQ